MAQAIKTNEKAWLGISLVVIGGVILLNNLDLIPSFVPYYVFSWEMIFIVIGTTMLLTRKKEGWIFLIIGGIFIIPDIFYYTSFHFRDWWPLIFVIIGISLILRNRNVFDRNVDEYGDDFLRDTNIFGGSEKSFSSQSFQGGKLTNVFGGSNIDLTDVKLAQQEVVIEIFCMFGGSEIRVPEDWTVIDESTIIFGAFNDKRRIPAEGYDPNKVLKLKGSVLFGGSEVRS
jgi:predicted membrane protein